MLAVEEPNGGVYVAWTDFAYIADRYGIGDKGPQFAMASEVTAPIASAATWSRDSGGAFGLAVALGPSSGREVGAALRIR